MVINEEGDIYITSNDRKLRKYDSKTFQCVEEKLITGVITDMRITCTNKLFCTAKDILHVLDESTLDYVWSNPSYLQSSVSRDGCFLATRKKKGWNLMSCSEVRFKTTKSAKSAIY